MLNKRNYPMYEGVNINSQMAQWKGLLISNNPIRELAFRQLFQESDLIIGRTVCKFRRLLIDQGIGQNISAENLDYIEQYCGEQDLQIALEQLFQEPVQLDICLKCIKKNGWTWEDVMEEHKKDKYKRLWRIISCRRDIKVA